MTMAMTIASLGLLMKTSEIMISCLDLIRDGGARWQRGEHRLMAAQFDWATAITF